MAKRVFRALGSAPTIRPCARYGCNKVHPGDATAGVTGLRDIGRVLYRCPPAGECAHDTHGIRGLRPAIWRRPAAEHPPAVLRRVVGGLEAVGHMWTSLSWEAALYREWVKHRRDPTNTRQSLTLTALWDRATGAEHEVLMFSNPEGASRHLQQDTKEAVVKVAVASKAVIIRHGRGCSDQPAVDSPGVLSMLDVPLSELPQIGLDAVAPLYKFRRLLPLALRDRVAAWQAGVRTALSDQLIERLTVAASQRAAESPEDAALGRGEDAPRLKRFRPRSSDPCKKSSGVTTEA